MTREIMETKEVYEDSVVKITIEKHVIDDQYENYHMQIFNKITQTSSTVMYNDGGLVALNITHSE